MLLVVVLFDRAVVGNSVKIPRSQHCRVSSIPIQSVSHMVIGSSPRYSTSDCATC